MPINTMEINPVVEGELGITFDGLYLLALTKSGGVMKSLLFGLTETVQVSIGFSLYVFSAYKCNVFFYHGRCVAA